MAEQRFWRVTYDRHYIETALLEIRFSKAMYASAKRLNLFRFV